MVDMRSDRQAAGFESRTLTSGGDAEAAPASRVRTRRTRAEAGRGDGNSYPGAGGLAPRPAHIVICQLCRRRLHRQRNGEWYHTHNASVSCRPGQGSEQRATPLRCR